MKIMNNIDLRYLVYNRKQLKIKMNFKFNKIFAKANKN